MLRLCSSDIVMYCAVASPIPYRTPPVRDLVRIGRVDNAASYVRSILRHAPRRGAAAAAAAASDAAGRASTTANPCAGWTTVVLADRLPRHPCCRQGSSARDGSIPWRGGLGTPAVKHGRRPAARTLPAATNPPPSQDRFGIFLGPLGFARRSEARLVLNGSSSQPTPTLADKPITSPPVSSLARFSPGLCHAPRSFIEPNCTNVECDFIRDAPFAPRSADFPLN